MSKERDLLERWVKIIVFPDYYPLRDETKELLAQPEQEQEVYAKGYAEAMRRQVYEAFEAGRKSALSNDWDKERDVMSIAWCLSESKQKPVAWIDAGNLKSLQESTGYALRYLTTDAENLKVDDVPLYLSPTRAPLDDADVEIWYSQHTWAMDKEEYMWGFRDAEIAHGIGVSHE